MSGDVVLKFVHPVPNGNGSWERFVRTAVSIVAIAGSLTGLAVVSAASAQTPATGYSVNQDWDVNGDDPLGALMVRLNRQPVIQFHDDQAFDTPFTTESQPVSYYANRHALAATSGRDVWLEGSGFSDRLRLRMAGSLRRDDGAPVPPTPQDRAVLDADGYDVSYVRGWRSATARTPSGLEVTLTPHAGVGVGSRGGSAEAGATVRIGQGLSNMVQDGQEAFGDRGRWYLYAAGSGRAVGYNFARTRDGDYARSGVSQDSGAFLGDASLGVAWRKGDVQSSFGLVYREIEAEGLRGGRDFDRDADEGLVAFQLSIKAD